MSNVVLFMAGLGFVGGWALLMLGMIIGFGVGRYTEIKPWEDF